MESSRNETVVLVDQHDQELGLMEKLEAHRLGLLHRAISVFILNSKGELLIQQRADDKYHAGGQWANTCCTHPFPGESPAVAANRRLKEEMGLECQLKFAFSHLYKADVGQGLTEHELDHVFFGTTDVEPIPQPLEVKAWKYISWELLDKELKTFPSRYSPWLHALHQPALTYLKSTF